MRPQTEVPLYAVIVLLVGLVMGVAALVALDPGLLPGGLIRQTSTGVSGSWVILAAILFPMLMLFALLGLREAA